MNKIFLSVLFLEDVHPHGSLALYKMKSHCRPTMPTKRSPKNANIIDRPQIAEDRERGEEESPFAPFAIRLRKILRIK